VTWRRLPLTGRPRGQLDEAAFSGAPDIEEPKEMATTKKKSTAKKTTAKKTATRSPKAKKATARKTTAKRSTKAKVAKKAKK